MFAFFFRGVGGWSHHDAEVASDPARPNGVVAPLGVAGLDGSSFAWSSLLAVAALGCLGTALAYLAFTTLAGRVGASRGSITIYFVPVVAIALGVLVRGESVAPISIAGAALILLGAFLTSRREASP